MRQRNAFTLIELLIVIAILGVLAAVIIPNVGRFFGRGETEARRTEKDSVQAAMDNLMADNGLSTLLHRRCRQAKRSCSLRLPKT